MGRSKLPRDLLFVSLCSLCLFVLLIYYAAPVNAGILDRARQAASAAFKKTADAVKGTPSTSQREEKHDDIPVDNNNDTAENVTVRNKERTDEEDIKFISDLLSSESVRHPPVILIPGMASTRLRAWKHSPCKLWMNINVGDPVWLDTKMVVGATQCFLDCMGLDPLTQQDPPHCKLRPDEGLDGIARLDPGIITGPLSDIWSNLIELTSKFGWEPRTSLIAVPYDWRIPAGVLEARDSYFTQLKRTIEVAVDRTRGVQQSGETRGAFVFAHSQGNNIFRYFCEWLKYDIGMSRYKLWLDKNVDTFVALGAPMNGAIEGVRGLMSGITFGLPVSAKRLRRLTNQFGSTMWLLPFPPSRPSHRHTNAARASSYELPILNISLSEQDLSKDGEGGRTTVDILYDEKDLSTAKVFRDLSHLDDTFANLTAIHEKYYLHDSVFDAFRSWERPPIKKIICAYGINRATDRAYKYSYDRVNRDFVVDDVYRESGSDIVSKNSGKSVLTGLTPEEVETRKRTVVSGDGTVPYFSLSWCHDWLSDIVNVTQVPHKEIYLDTEVKNFQNINHAEFMNVRDTVGLTTVFESVVASNVRDDTTGIVYKFHYKTEVWELDQVEHRDIVNNKIFLNTLRNELRGALRSQIELLKVKSVVNQRWESSDIGRHRLARPPISDSECEWDYWKAACRWPEFCQYRYKFGDVHLSQSCRLIKKPHSVIAAASFAADGIRKGAKAVSSGIHASWSEFREAMGVKGFGVASSDSNEQCSCLHGSCLHGFCKYSDECQGSVQAFGSDNGWWGPCQM